MGFPKPMTINVEWSQANPGIGGQSNMGSRDPT